MEVGMMAVSSGYTIPNRGSFHPPSHVRRLEICSCHFLLSLLTIFSCHNTSPGQRLDSHSLNLLLGREKKKGSRKGRPPSNHFWTVFVSLSLSRSWSSFSLSFISHPRGKAEMHVLVFLHTWVPQPAGCKLEFHPQVQFEVHVSIFCASVVGRVGAACGGPVPFVYAPTFKHCVNQKCWTCLLDLSSIFKINTQFRR